MSPDPVTEAEAYRDLMFELAGEGDPSEAMRKTPATVREIVESAGRELRIRPAEGEWSVMELLGHMVDVEMVVGVRLRRTLAEPDPRLTGYDQDLWVNAQRYNDGDPEPLLRAIEGMRPLTVELYAATTPEDRQRTGLHSERGRETVETTYRMLAGHDPFHIDQMRRTLEQVRDHRRNSSS